MNAWVWPASSWCVPPVETQVVSIVPPGRAAFFLFPVLFSLSLLLFPVFSFLFVLSFSVCFLDRLLRFSFRFLALLGGGLCYSVILSRWYTPPALLASLQVCVFPWCAVFLRSWFLLHFILFSSLDSFSMSILTSFVSPCLFLVRIMPSARFRFLLRLV